MAIDYEKEFKIGSKGRLVDIEEKIAAPVQKQYNNIQFVGLEQLRPFQGDLLKSKAIKCYEEILSNRFKDIRYFMVQIKLHEAKDAGAQKYSLHLRLATPAQTFSSECASFRLDSAIIKAIKTLDSEIIRFKEKIRERRSDTGKGIRGMMKRGK